MGSAGSDALIGLLGLLLAFVSTVALILIGAARAGSLADHRDDRLRADDVAAPASRSCAPEAELTIGVDFHPAGAKYAMRALLEAERTAIDRIELVLQPVDGGDQSAIHMSRAAADAFAGLLARARTQEVQPNV